MIDDLLHQNEKIGFPGKTLEIEEKLQKNFVQYFLDSPSQDDNSMQSFKRLKTHDTLLLNKGAFLLKESEMSHYN